MLKAPEAIAVMRLAAVVVLIRSVGWVGQATVILFDSVARSGFAMWLVGETIQALFGVLGILFAVFLLARERRVYRILVERQEGR